MEMLRVLLCLALSGTVFSKRIVVRHGHAAFIPSPASVPADIAYTVVLPPKRQRVMAAKAARGRISGQLQQVRKCTTALVRDLDPESDMRQVTDLRTAVFAPYLKRGADLYLQARAWEEAMANKTAVFVAIDFANLAKLDVNAPTPVGAPPVSSVPSQEAVKAAWRAKIRSAEQLPSIIGTVDMLMLDSGRACYVVNLCTKPNARRRGVARQLMEHIAERASVLGAHTLALHVETDNAAAMGLYESLGFVRNEEARTEEAVAEFAPDPEEPPRILLVKPLGHCDAGPLLPQHAQHASAAALVVSVHAVPTFPAHGPAPKNWI